MTHVRKGDDLLMNSARSNIVVPSGSSILRSAFSRKPSIWRTSFFAASTSLPKSVAVGSPYLPPPLTIVTSQVVSSIFSTITVDWRFERLGRNIVRKPIRRTRSHRSPRALSMRCLGTHSEHRSRARHGWWGLVAPYRSVRKIVESTFNRHHHGVADSDHFEPRR